jgi:hypothetical protein
MVLSMVAMTLAWAAAGGSSLSYDAWGSPRPGPTPVRYVSDYLPPSGYVCPAVPEIIARAGEILAAVDSPQRRSQLAEQWLQYSKQVIAKDQEYRRQWLDFQRQQLRQQQQVEQLRLEVARLQAQMEELRAQNARLEQENLYARSQGGSESGPQAARTALPTPVR